MEIKEMIQAYFDKVPCDKFTEVIDKIAEDTGLVAMMVGAILGKENSLEESDFKIEEFLLNDGFRLNFEKNEHTTYEKNGMYVRLFWDGDMLNEDGYCISMSVYRLSDGIDTLYFGKHPANPNEYEVLFKKLLS